MIIFEVTKVSLYKQVKSLKTKAHETKGLKTKEKSNSPV